MGHLVDTKQERTAKRRSRLGLSLWCRSRRASGGTSEARRARLASPVMRPLDRRSGCSPAEPYPPSKSTGIVASFDASTPPGFRGGKQVGVMIPRRAREPHGVGRRPPAGEPRVLCTFQLDTRSFDRFVSGTPCASGALVDLHRPALILMGDWCGSSI